VLAVLAATGLFAFILGEVDMKFAIIEQGVVVNIVVATPEFAAQQGWIECPEGVSIGWRFDGVEASAPEPDLEAIAASERFNRDSLLVESDVNVLPDRWAAMTTEQQVLWATYRQALRDIPQQAGFPTAIVWPTKP